MTISNLMIERRPPSFYQIKFPVLGERTVVGTRAKLGEDGSIYILDGDDSVVAAYAPGSWSSFESKPIPMVTINTEVGEAVGAI